MTSDRWVTVPLREVATQFVDRFVVQSGESYSSLGVKWYAEGVFAREPKLGSEIKAKNLYRVRPGQFIYNRMFATEGSFALVRDAHADGVVSNEFPVFDLDPTRLLPDFLALHFQQPAVWERVAQECVGTTKSRSRWKEERFLAYKLALPPMAEQRRMVDLIGAVDVAIEGADSARDRLTGARMTWRRQLFEQAESSSFLPLAKLATTRLGKMLSSTTATKDPEGPYLRNADVQWARINTENLKTMPFSPADRLEFSLLKGDVLVCEGGEIGRCSVLEEDLPGVFFQKALHRVRCGETLDPYFLQLWMEHMAEDGTLLLFSGSSTIPHLTGEKLRKLPVPQFSLERQTEAASFNKAFANSVSGHEAVADKLRGLRAEMLSALLSGAHRIPETYDELMGA